MSALSMVLPAVDTQGYVPDAVRSFSDVRVPRPIRRHGDVGEVRVLGGHTRCVDEGPRHLWDILETCIWREAQDERGDWCEEATYREVLTCVRCGRVEQREGTRRDAAVRHIDVAPLRAGDLRAQEVERTTFFSGTASSYVVVDQAGAPAGRISWARGSRGREYYVGVLGDDHPRATPEAVEAPTAIGVLRKLARSRPR
jgi:hypothetical protein